VAQVRPVIVPLWVRQTKGSAAREIQMTGAGLVGCASPEVSRSSPVSYEDPLRTPVDRGGRFPNLAGGPAGPATLETLHCCRRA
jgi:hypothetical protein